MHQITNSSRRWLATLAVLAVPAAAPAWAEDEITLSRDNVALTKSVKIKPGIYTIRDADNNGILHVKGRGIVIDFQGATLRGLKLPGADLSTLEGIGIAVHDAAEVTIRNAKIHGYRYNIHARKAPGLRLEDCDTSWSRAHRIAERGRPVEIWLVLRSLEAWRDYGGGVWIEDSDRCVVERCRGTGAQNGLLLIGCNDGRVSECDYSFNSGFGVGLWNSSRNTVAWNRLDFVNRPWGGGWGGDSAALVVVNHSHENFFVGNSLTHSGDGFFLTDRLNGGFDGQKKTSNFDGACNRNVVAYNDGSYSTANAFEGTFSTGNIYYRNWANDSNFGFWLGFSDESVLLKNEILRNRFDGIAIENGRGTRIKGNVFGENRGAAIALWAGGEPWVRERHPSTDIDIRDNLIRECGRDCRLDGSTQVSTGGNRLEKTPEAKFAYVDRPPALALGKFRRSAAYGKLQEILATRPKDFVMLRDEDGPKGVGWIQADDYAPRDYRGQLVLWRPRDAGTLELLPVTKHKLAFATPDWMSVSYDEAAGVHVASAEPRGEAGEWKTFTLQVSAEGARKAQIIRGTLLTAEWEVRWYRWDRPEKLAYEDADGWQRLFAAEPLYRQKTRDLSSRLWTEGHPPNVPRSHFALVATTQLKLPAGKYRVNTLSDDGLRLFINDKEVISRWNHHGPAPDEAEVELDQGLHRIRVHYCQEDGASALSFSLQPLEKK